MRELVEIAALAVANDRDVGAGQRELEVVGEEIPDVGNLLFDERRLAPVSFARTTPGRRYAGDSLCR